MPRQDAVNPSWSAGRAYLDQKPWPVESPEACLRLHGRAEVSPLLPPDAVRDVFPLKALEGSSLPRPQAEFAAGFDELSQQ